MQAIKSIPLISLLLVLAVCTCQAAYQYPISRANIGQNQVQSIPIDVNEAIDSNHDVVPNAPLHETKAVFDAEIVAAPSNGDARQGVKKTAKYKNNKHEANIVTNTTITNSTTTPGPDSATSSTTAVPGGAKGSTVIPFVSGLIVVALALMTSLALVKSQFSSRNNF